MTKLRLQVSTFHKAGGHPIADRPTIPPEDRLRLRARLIAEECFEFLEAMFPHDESDLLRARGYVDEVIRVGCVQVDFAAAVDALADIDYVVEGTRLEFGVQGDEIADEVHRANMDKFRGGARDDGKGKTLKPEGWRPPDIVGVLRNQGWLE